MTGEIITTEQGGLMLTNRLPMDQRPAAVYLAGLSKGSRATMRQALNVIAGLLTNGQADCFSLDWAAIRYQHTQAIRAQLAERYAAATANKMLCALRSILKAAWLLGQMSAEDYHRAAAVESVKGETLPAGRHIPRGEIAALMDACASDPTPAGARDAAIIGLAYAAGLRRAEIVSLDLSSFDKTTGQVKVRGKRNKTRTTYLDNGAAAAMADWLDVRGLDPGPLFLAINKGGKLQPRRLTTQAIYNVLVKRAKEAQIAQPFSPHDFRRTFISDLLEAGADISTVSNLAGHVNVQTTLRYDRRGEQAKIKAASLLHTPYTRRKAKGSKT